MNILAFESTCDETAVAVVADGRKVLSDVIASQVDMHTIYGGVVPEIASRKHVEAITGLADRALTDAGLTKRDIDAVAVSYAPGLIGAVLVGVNFAKSVATHSCPPYSRTYCSQLYCPSRFGTAIYMLVCFGRQYADYRCKGIHRHGSHGRYP